VTVAATTPESAEPILRLRGIGRRFGGVHAVRDVDLDVHPGERRALLGPNGAGKTTLFNVVSGELPPTAGRVELFGRDVTTMPARTRAKLGLTRTFQTSRLFLGLTVEDNLYLAVLGVRSGHLRPVRLPGRDGALRQRARDLAERVGRDVTLVLIEHDMDVALRVAERVTMMHDGRVIVEGTPAQIRANQLVHDLYLGSRYTDE
jgi:branched-chain amino acid transport system ATP-binding protein